MFVVIYQPTEQLTKMSTDSRGLTSIGEWKVDTDSNGAVDTYRELFEALDRVVDLRSKGGEACLAVIIE